MQFMTGLNPDRAGIEFYGSALDPTKYVMAKIGAKPYENFTLR